MTDRELVCFALAQWFDTYALTPQWFAALSEFERQHWMDRMTYELEEDSMRRNLGRESLPWESR